MSTGDTPERGRLEPSDLVGRVFADRYLLTRLVSSGANTSVFDAADQETGRVVTVKVLRPSIAASPSFRERFDGEMRAVAAMSHPNIVALYDWGIAPVGDLSTAYVVTEALGGGSVRDMFDRGRRLSPSQALTVGLDACRGLDYAHRRGFVHTELTPSKLVFGDDRRLRIADFGLSRLLGDLVWSAPESVPNHVAAYAAPEQGAGEPLDGRADVYALCLSLHEAVTGVLPFKTDSTVATLAARVGRLMPVSADLGPLAAVFERAGRPEAAERATAAEFGKGLVQAASKLPRPEPLPLLSTGLFETPVEQLRDPNDPTGGVTRPAAGAGVLVVPTDSSDESSSVTDPSGELVIAPIDSELDGGPDAVLPDPEPIPVGAQIGDHGDLTFNTDQLTVGAPTSVMPTTHSVAPASRRRRGVPWKLLLAALVAAALIVLGVLASSLFKTPEYVVPDLVGVPEAEARNLVAPNGWDVVVERERSDLIPTVGQVISTAPTAGVSLAEGEPFLLVISEGPVLRELPDSTGFTLAEAQNRLAERDLAVEFEEQFDEVVPTGTVMSWSVPGDPTLGTGSFVLPGTEVLLVVSQGPAPRTVPDVVDTAVSDARLAVEELALVYVEERQEFSDDIGLGRVISQTPEPGAEVARGDTVSVVVSRGPDLVTFPTLADGIAFDDAAVILRDAGFDPVLVFGDSQGEVRSATIDGQDAEPGTTYRRGTRVEIEALTL